MDISAILLSDAYKHGHSAMMPKGTTFLQNNFTPRKSRLPGITHYVWFGLSYYLQEYLIHNFQKNFFQQPIKKAVGRYKAHMDHVFGPNVISTEEIKNLHKLQMLPLRIEALPEGSYVPVGVPAMIMYNLKPEFAWLTQYLEIQMSNTLWPCVWFATNGVLYKEVADHFVEVTNPEKQFMADFLLHDFGARGQFGNECSLMEGAAWALSHKGSDVVHALSFIEDYYLGDIEKGNYIKSIPASEHSVMSMGGDKNEAETILNILNTFSHTPVSIVMDTWNYWQSLVDFMCKDPIKSTILERNPEHFVVTRPDSGDPYTVICGDDRNPCPFDNAEWNKAVHLGVVETLANQGFLHPELTSTGFKQLLNVGSIYGEAISIYTAKRIYDKLAKKGFAATTAVLGCGSFSQVGAVQLDENQFSVITRDTLGIAIKATYCEVEGVPREIFKSPITGSDKKSAKGLIAVRYDENGEYKLFDQLSDDEAANTLFKEVFENGRIRETPSFEQIQQRLLKDRRRLKNRIQKLDEAAL